MRHGETVNPPAIERAAAETPHLKRGASDFYPSGRITGNTGKAAEDEKVAAGSAVATKRSNFCGAKGPYHL